ncbi:hypothetical protein GGR56DRAFT_621023 [Xylariaceae sp. FL0804]|nr:hypothetical protein GGR56DRAFT_621023 [Xylariaceae sp. FL0804]
MLTPLVGAPRGLRTILLPLAFLASILAFVALYHNVGHSADFLTNLTAAGGRAQQSDQHVASTHPPPKYKPTPTAAAPIITDPFPLLATSTAAPPPIPEYNVPRADLHRDYGLSYQPPLFIGFTRQWPMLLQCVVSYITAGWPPESIYVVENTGVQSSNADGRLSLQNPFYLNHTTLRRLGVNVLPTPVLLTFSQMQNFFLSTASAQNWTYYFYSHQDVLVFSFEDGADFLTRPGDREWFFYDEQDEVDTMRPPAAGQPGYRTIYENCLRELNRTLETEQRWGFRWFQYDHLTLVNRAALDAVGGWDSLMPYYGSDCDMNARLEMDGWTMRHRRVGIINDVSTVMDDVAALYRDPLITPKFTDPNPIPEEELNKLGQTKQVEQSEASGAEKTASKKIPHTPREQSSANVSKDTAHTIDYFRALVEVGDDMGSYKYRDDKNARNSWQSSQHGGVGEPYYYNADGFATSFWILAEAGREVFRQKWGHRDCNLVEETALKLDDQWRVEKDWKD